MNRDVGWKTGASPGEVLEVDVTGEGVGWGKNLHIQVNLDVTKPLEKSRALQLEGKVVWVSFKYEKLPNFCFTCGRILHGPRGCPSPHLRISGNFEDHKWGLG